MGAEFTPTQNSYKELGAFRFWCQKVLPMVYDDSLSYYEVLGKLTNYLNEVIENSNAMGKDVTSLYEAYTLLQSYVNNYFASLEIQAEINNGLDRLAKNGTLGKLLAEYVQPIVDEQNQLIAEQTQKVDNVALNSAANANEIAVLKARMDTFTALPEGADVSSAELEDIRVAYDGTTYDNAGNAVRGQYGMLNERFNTIYPPLPIVWRDGYYFRASTGGYIPNDVLSASEYIDVSNLAGFELEIRSRTTSTQGFAFLDVLNSVIDYRDGSSEGITENLSTVKIKVPTKAISLVITSLTEEKAKCFVRPAISIVGAVDFTKKWYNIIYPKLTTTWVDGTYIGSNDGDIRNNDSFAGSDYIDVSIFSGMMVEIRCRMGDTFGFAFYDSNKTYISGGGTTEYPDEYGIVRVPNGATYVRITAIIGAKEHAYIRPIPNIEDAIKGKSGNRERMYPLSIAMFGDSITLGRDGDGDSASRTPYTIPYTIGKMLDVNCVNYGVGSMGYVAEGGGMNAYDKIASTELGGYDVITLCFGVNDHSKTLGSWNSEDETTVMGQFNKCIRHIGAANPNAIVVVFGPFNGRNAGSFPDYWFGQSWFKIDELLKQACDYYGIPYVSQKSGPINGYNIQTFIGADGVHPSNLGYQRIGAWFAGQLSKIIG